MASTAATAAESLWFICMSPPTKCVASIPSNLTVFTRQCSLATRPSHALRKAIPGHTMPEFSGARNKLEKMLRLRNVKWHVVSE